MNVKFISDNIEELLKFSTIINSSLQIEEIRKRACEAAMKLCECEAASLLLFNEDKQELYFDVTLGEKAEKIKTIRLKIGQGIAGWVAKHKKAVIINNVQEDQRFFREADEISGFKTKTMLCIPVLIKDRLLGILQAINKKEDFFNEYDLEILTVIGSQVAVAIENSRLYNELKETFYSVVFALADTIEKRDPYTGGHTRRVMNYSIATGIEMGLNSEEIEKLKLAAILHDIGKIGIRDFILLKEGMLTDEEFSMMKNHTIYGAEILSQIKQLKEIVNGVKYHHEKFDGTGYPEGLRGEEIPIIARIIAVADAFDAMTTDRPYRKGLSSELAIRELKNSAGSQFDPMVIEAFIKAYNKTKFSL